MAATTMPSIDLLIKQLQQDFPAITFCEAEQFSWAPKTQTITYMADEPHCLERLLHEVAHALLDHHMYERDIDLIAMERDAWQRARRELAKKYNVAIATDVIEKHMDTYRDWLHARSTCPFCTATGIQTANKHYKCVACLKEWDVNEARVCALRRYKR